MKLWQTFAFALFSSAVALNAQADSTTKSTKATKTAQTNKENVALKNFNSSVKIRFVERGMTQDDEGKPNAFFRYEIENKSKTPITYLNWIAVFTENQETLYARNIQIEFPKNAYFEPKKPLSIIVQVPLDILPEKARIAFSNKQAEIDSVPVARELRYSNNKRIVIKQ